MASGKFKVKVAWFPCCWTRPATEKEPCRKARRVEGILGMQTLRLNIIHPNHIYETCVFLADLATFTMTRSDVFSEDLGTNRS